MLLFPIRSNSGDEGKPTWLVVPEDRPARPNFQTVPAAASRRVAPIERRTDTTRNARNTQACCAFAGPSAEAGGSA
jgi:hypothetical protein